MGSKVTEDERVMRIVLEVCKENGLFYLDSMTSSKSVVEKLAKEMNVPYLENDLFFDEVYTTRHISKQANLVTKKIPKDEQLIAIGHVGITGPKMVTVLKEYIPVYEKGKDCSTIRFNRGAYIARRSSVIDRDWGVSLVSFFCLYIPNRYMEKCNE